MDLEVLGSLSNVQLAVYNYYFLRAQQCLHQTCFIQSGWMEFSVDFFAQNNGTALTSRFTRVRVIPRMARRYLTWHCLFLENHSTCMSRSINFAFFPELLSHTNGKYSLFPNRTLKPSFHMILQIVLIAPVVSKNFEMIETTGMIGSFNVILSIASKTRDVGSSAMSLGQTTEFLRMFSKQAQHSDGF